MRVLAIATSGLVATIAAAATLVAFGGCATLAGIDGKEPWPPDTGLSETGDASLDGADAGPCAPPRLACGTKCVDPTTDPGNCGGCGINCGAGSTCFAGKCQCKVGTTDCGKGCVDLTKDPLNCNACGTVCPAKSPTCTSGTCACGVGATVCTERCTDGAADALNCSACGTACATYQYCDGTGKCACRPGLTDCGGSCIDTKADPNNCGACGKTCTGALGFCANGKCNKNCDKPATVCDLLCTHTDRDPLNCGACGKACAAGELCAGGVCRAYVPAVGCTACPCGSCATLLAGSVCCPALSGHKQPECVVGECP